MPRKRTLAPETEHHDHEGLEQLARSEARVEGKQCRAEQTGDGRQRRAEAERQRVDSLDADAHQRAAVRVLRDRADGFAEIRSGQKYM